LARRFRNESSNEPLISHEHDLFLVALEIVEQEPERRERLWANARRMQKEFRTLGFDTGVTETPIIPVIIGSNELTFRFWKTLFEEGVFTNPVVSPAVPEGHAIIRTSYMASHTDEHLDFVLDRFEKVGKHLGIIPGGTRRARTNERRWGRFTFSKDRLTAATKTWLKNLWPLNGK